MTHDEWTTIAAEVLATCKQANPRFPNPDPDRPRIWGYTMRRSGLPPWKNLWIEAVGDYFTHPQGDAIPLPNDIIQAARRVRDRQETDPRLKARWDAMREQRREAIDKQIATGTHRLQLESKRRTPKRESERSFDVEKIISQRWPSYRPDPDRERLRHVEREANADDPRGSQDDPKFNPPKGEPQ